MSNKPKFNIPKKALIELYVALLKPRLIEEKMLLLLRQGKVSKWFSGIGQEAIAVGSTLALEPDEFILPLHRNLGVFTARDIPLAKLLAQFQGRTSGFTKGRDRSFHFGTIDYHIIGMISHLGAQMAVADGIALAHKLKKTNKATLVYCGDGGSSEGDFHESINLAAVWDLPVIFLIENNGWGLSTPVREQYRCHKLSDRALGYGIPGITIDGNNPELVYQTIKQQAAKVRKSNQPVIIECLTFRIRGHEEASGTKYVDPKLIAKWQEKDPVNYLEKSLLKRKILTKEFIAETRTAIAAEIDGAVEVAWNEDPPVASTEQEVLDVYLPYQQDVTPVPDQKVKMRLVDALNDGLGEAMKKHDNLVIMGQDIAEYGGVFKVTEGLADKFGKERVRNTPICESAVIGAGLGLSIGGYKSIIEMQFADFVSCGFNQIINNLAKSHYRWGQNADVVVRLPTGAGVGAGPFHSQSNEAWFFHTPGLKVVYPATPSEAKGLLLASISDPNPVIFMEHKALYRSLEEEVPVGYYETELGKARFVREGTQVAIITYGAGVHWAKALAEENPKVSTLILDLRTLLPFDWEAIEQAVRSTGKVLVLHEDTLTGGIGAEISSLISERLFSELDAPVMRCASLDTPVPFAGSLEANFLAKSRLGKIFTELVAY